MRADGIFIALEVSEQTARDTTLAAKLAEACPVDIFGQAGDGSLELVEGNLDECVLCGLCLAVVDGVGVEVIKLYDEGAKLTA